MVNEIKKCEKCGLELRQSDQYAHFKREGKQGAKGPDMVSFTCMNEKCEDFSRNIQMLMD